MRALIFISFFSTFTILAISQPDFKFIRYTTTNGLAQNYVMTLCQDNFGFLWIGTRNGVSRFDGINFKTWQYSENKPGSIGEGWINQIVCDSKNRLWLAIAGPGSTFMRFDYESEKFTDVGSVIKAQTKINNKLFDFGSVFIDSEGLLWLGATNVIVCYNPDDKSIVIYSNQPDFIRDFIEDDFNNIWIATNQGLSVLNKTNRQIITYRYNPNNPQSISSDNCNGLFQDIRGRIWVGTYKGVNCFKPSSSKPPIFKHFINDPNNPHSLSHNVVNDIGEDINNNILIATIDGLNLIDEKTNKVYRYYNDETDNESINSNLIRCIFRDHQGNTWIGTSSGVGKIQFKNFTSYSHSANKNSISHNKVQSLCESITKELWIATPKGIDIFNIQNQRFRFIAGITNNKKGLYGSPLNLCPEGDKGMWIGTWAGGFSFIDYFTNKITNYISFKTTKNITNVYSVLVDRKNNLWVGTQGTGLYLFNSQKELDHVFLNDEDNKLSLGSDWINGIMEDSRNNVWVGTNHGLDMITDVEKGCFHHYLNNLGINCFIEGSDNNLWIGTNKGMYHYNRKTGNFKNFDTEIGLPGSNVFCILEDNSNDLWISTDKGLSRATPTQDSVINITIFRKEDGLTIESFLPWSGTKLSNGSLLFGGTEGFCMFQPENVQNDSIPPKIIFTDLKVANKIVEINKEINGQVILKESISITKHLIFNHKNNEFAIEFIGLQYNMPQYNKYCYRLDGRDEPGKWHYTNAGKRAVEYMNLPGGEYSFKVKAANSYGVWNNVPAVLNIRILPPWWKTWWFYATGILIVIISIFVFVKLRIYNLKKQKEHLEKIVEVRTSELKEINVILEEKKEELEVQAKQMEEKTEQVEQMANQLHESAQSKLRFFANISHEFRTPLSLIIAPLEKYAHKKKLNHLDEWLDISKHQQLMLRNAKRLLRLVNEIIDFRKIEQGQKKLNKTNNNIQTFIAEIINMFSPMAEAKNIQLSLNIEHPSLIIDHLSFNKKHLPLNPQPQQDKQFKTETPSNKVDQMSNNECNMINEQYNMNNDKWSMTNDKCKMLNEFWFDPDVMEKILCNLISNAIKYTPEGGEIKIAIGVVDAETRCIASLQNTQLAIEIFDTGIGIKPENLDKIFDRFYRVETDEKYAKGGSGIGLAFTKELVKLHGGEISVESKPGVGSKFTVQFHIPLNTSKNPEELRQNNISGDTKESLKLYTHDYIKLMIAEQDTEENLEDNTYSNINDKMDLDNPVLQKKTETILLIEDNADLRGFIKNELETQYVILEAENGEEGWETAVRTDPNLILSDVMMPCMDGIELCRKIKTDENTCHIPVILLTAKSGDDNIFRGLETGADDYLTKPFNLNILKTKIHNLLLLRKRLHDKFARSEFTAPPALTISQFDEKFMKKAFEVVNENFQDYEFDNEAFVKLMDGSRSLVYKKIKNLTNQSVGEFIRNIRLKAAAKLFSEGNDNITEVCYLTGFKYPNNFTHYFSNTFGKTPSQFIKERIRKT